MATNEILQFAATDTGTNLLTQAEYVADAQRPIGNQPGLARSKLVNKALRQSSLVSAAVAQFIADSQANNVVDTAAAASLATWLADSVRAVSVPVAVAGGTANALTADFAPNAPLTAGRPICLRAVTANTGAVTLDTDESGPKAVVKGNDLPLVAGDIAGAGHWLELNYDTTLAKWVLQNPAKGVAPEAGAKGGGTDKIFWENDQTMTTDYTITTNKNAVVAGPLTINNGVTLTVPTGSVLTIV